MIFIYRFAPINKLIILRHGTLSGTFILLQKSQGKRTSYIWMIKEKGTAKWKLADFGQKASGLNVDATPGVVYEFKAQYKNSKGKSAWTQIIEIICI